MRLVPHLTATRIGTIFAADSSGSTPTFTSSRNSGTTATATATTAASSTSVLILRRPEGATNFWTTESVVLGTAVVTTVPVDVLPGTVEYPVLTGFVDTYVVDILAKNRKFEVDEIDGEKSGDEIVFSTELQQATN